MLSYNKLTGLNFQTNGLNVFHLKRWTPPIRGAEFDNSHSQYLSPCQEHKEIQSSLPSKYYPCPALFNFSTRMGTGLFYMARPLCSIFALFSLQFFLTPYAVAPGFKPTSVCRVAPLKDALPTELQRPGIIYNHAALYRTNLRNVSDSFKGGAEFFFNIFGKLYFASLSRSIPRHFLSNLEFFWPRDRNRRRRFQPNRKKSGKVSI